MAVKYDYQVMHEWTNATYEEVETVTTYPTTRSFNDQIDTTAQEGASSLMQRIANILKIAIIGSLVGLALAWAYGADDAAAYNANTDTVAWITVLNPQTLVADQIKVVGDNDQIMKIEDAGYPTQIPCPSGTVRAEDLSCVKSNFYAQTDYEPVKYNAPHPDAVGINDPKCYDAHGFIYSDGCLGY